MTMDIFSRAQRYHQWLFYETGDPRVQNWFLMTSPEPTIVILALYILVVQNGPAIMKERAPFQLKNVLLVYNFAMVALSTYMCYEFVMTAFWSGYGLTCQPLDFSENPLNLRLASVSWWFFFSKIIELADTVFFIMRKKDQQLTFLHVYHHFTMIINWWMAVKWVPVGQSFMVGVINSFVHMLMYTYYALAALGPHMQKYLWWKRYMTRIQLIQFVLVVSHTGYSMFAPCNYPWLYNYITFYYTWTVLFLFLHFYYNTYVVKNKGTVKDGGPEGCIKIKGANNNISRKDL